MLHRYCCLLITYNLNPLHYHLVSYTENEEQPQKELTTESLHRHTQESHDSKMKNILSFLDEVETSDRLEEIDQVSSCWSRS